MRRIQEPIIGNEGEEQAWRSGGDLPPTNETWVHLPVSTTYVHAWVEVAVGSIPCSSRSKGGEGYSSFPHSSKSNIFKF